MLLGVYRLLPALLFNYPLQPWGCILPFTIFTLLWIQLHQLSLVRILLGYHLITLLSSCYYICCAFHSPCRCFVCSLLFWLPFDFIFFIVMPCPCFPPSCKHSISISFWLLLTSPDIFWAKLWWKKVTNKLMSDSKHFLYLQREGRMVVVGILS